MEESLPVFRFDLKAAAVLLGCATGAAATGWLLYADLHFAGDAGQGPAMGRIERRQSKVRRKPQTSFVWSNLNDQDPLYKRDYVQTGPGSSALIQLKDGASLELRENSLIIVDDSSKLAVGFVRGGGILRTQQGDAKISASEKGEAKVEALPVRMLQPAYLSEFAARGASTSVPFSWAWQGEKPSDPVLQVSSSPRFGRRETREIRVGTKDSSEVQLGPGKWFWRIVKSGKPLGEASSFQVSLAPDARLTYPLSGQTLRSFGENAPTQFRWALARSSEGSESLQTLLEIAADASFSKTIRTETALLQSQGVTVTGLPSGSYWWRLKTAFKGTDVLSTPQSFSISRKDRIAVQALGPDDGGNQILKGPVAFSWTTDDTSSDFGFQIEMQDESEKTLFKTPLGPVSQWSWSQASPGTYRWRIVAETRGRLIGESAWRKISLLPDLPVALRTPEAGARFNFWDSPTPVEFEWAEDKLAAADGYQFQLQVSPMPDFSRSITSLRTRSRSLKVPRLDPALARNGQFYWKVQVLNPKGQMVKTSEIRPLHYSLHPLPLPPVTAGIEGNLTQYNPLEHDNRPPRIVWKPVPEVSEYELTVMRAGPGAPRKILQKIVRGEEFTPTELDEGRYEIAVRSVDRIQRKGEPASSAFTITFGDILPPPKPESEVFQ